MAVYDGVTEISYLRVGRDGLVLPLRFRVIHHILCDFSVKVLDSVCQESFKVGVRVRLTNELGAKRPGDDLLLPQHHFRVRLVVAIKRNDSVAAFTLCVYMVVFMDNVYINPLNLIRVNHALLVQLLEKQNVRCNICPRAVCKGCVGQTDRADQVTSLGQVLPHPVILFIERAAADAVRGDKGHDSPWTDFVDHLCKEIIMDKEIQLVIAFVPQLEIAKGHVTDGGVKKAVREICFFKPLNSDGGLLIKLSGNTSTDAV